MPPHQLPGQPSGQEDAYPWVQAMQAARRRLPRVKVAIATAGTFLFGLIAAVAAAQTGSAAGSPPSPAPPASSSTTDIFGQVQTGPDNQPGADSAPANPGGADTAPGAQAPPPIVSAQS